MVSKTCKLVIYGYLLAGRCTAKLLVHNAISLLAQPQTVHTHTLLFDTKKLRNTFGTSSILSSFMFMSEETLVSVRGCTLTELPCLLQTNCLKIDFLRGAAGQHPVPEGRQVFFFVCCFFHSDRMNSNNNDGNVVK